MSGAAVIACVIVAWTLLGGAFALVVVACASVVSGRRIGE